MFSELRLIIWKNLLIRKRHWFLTIVETLIPILLFTGIAYGRSKINGLNKLEVQAPQHYEPETEDLLNSHIPFEPLKIWYAPATKFTEQIIENVKIKFQKPSDSVREFVSEAKLLEHYNKYNSDEETIVAVIFHGDDPKHLDYDLRVHEKYLSWNTDKLYGSTFSDFEDSGSSKYIFKGFVGIQLAINKAFLETSLHTDNLNVSFSVQQFPYPPHTQDSGLNELFMNFLPLITIFSFIFLCPAVLKRVIEEKASGIKELMKMVGLKPWMSWLGWFIHGLFTNLFSIIIIVVLMKVRFWGVEYPPIEHCSGTVLFTFFLLYCMAAIMFCFLISAIFSKPSVGMVIGIIIWIFSYFIPRAILSSHENMRWKHKILFGIFPNMALHYGYNAISIYETREIGVQWHNLHESGSGGYEDITMLNVFIIFLVDMLIFMVLTIYIDNINPGEFGIPKPIFYPVKFLTNFLRSRKKCSIDESSELDSLKSHVEPPNGEERCIEINHLVKRYNSNVAVDNLSLDIYKNQITVLLGENGAGKTTTMSIITGMTAATSGYVKIDGRDLRCNVDEVRQRMGLCPQHNLLFPDLTVAEHLKFFAMLKGRSSKKANDEVDKILKTLNLEQKRNDLPCSLSGGMKRKLCLGMALIGDSQVLVLDEPTSGMDYESRHSMWEFLKNLKQNKTILITTHFMDEADALADWICILYRGRLQCYGRPMFLKNIYKTGYRLSLMLNKEDNIENVKSEIPKILSSVEYENKNGKNIVFKLPTHEEKRKFVNFFAQLEDHKDEYGINKISLTVTNLDDVFLKAKQDADSHMNKNCVKDTDSQERDQELNDTNGRPNIIKKFKSLLIKRYYFLKRKFLFYIPGTAVALAIFLTTFILAQGNTEYYGYGGPPLNLTLQSYGKTLVYYSGLENFANHYKTIASTEEGKVVGVQNVSQSIIDKGTENIAFYKKHMIAAAEFKIQDGEVNVNCLYSSHPLHSAPISLNLGMNAAAKALLGSDYSITTRNSPLKTNYVDLSPSEISEVQMGILWFILIPIGCLFMMSNFIIFPNFEVSTNFIRIQLMTGMSPLFYWLSHVVFDYVLFIVKSSVIFLILFLVNIIFYQSFGSRELGVLIIIFYSYALAAIPFTYLFSFKKSIAGGFAVLIMVGLFTGLVPTLAVGIMEFSDDEYYEHIATILKYIFMTTCPQFALSYICMKFSRKFAQNYNWANMDQGKKDHICRERSNPCCRENTLECVNYKSYFANEELGIHADIWVMLVAFALYLGILCFLQSRHVEKITSFLSNSYNCCLLRMKKDSLDKKDSEASQSNCNDVREGETNGLIANHISKRLGGRKIVRNVSMYAEKGKCFGLLGVNGAGKTTTFRMLTAELSHDEGNISFKEGNEKNDINDGRYCEKIGYCPQQDVLNYALTGRELITIMAIMKGHNKPDKVADILISLFDLKNYADKPCVQYSGGNKRKLNTCLAFINLPSLILLDEPTSGVDPSARRKFWDTLSRVKKEHGTSFVLCSHSMDECEALSDYIGIMKEGKIEDQGSLMDLKDKHQKGFSIKLKLIPHEIENTIKDSNKGTDVVDSPNNKQEQQTSITIDDSTPHESTVALRKQESISKLRKDMIERLTKNDPNSEGKIELKEDHTNSLYCLVKNPEKRLSDLFKVANDLKDEYPFIEDFVITDSSLEDIFLSVASTNS